jgi:hypothetical protein
MGEIGKAQTAMILAFLAHLRAKQFPCNLLHNMNFDALAAFAKAVSN